MVPFSILQLLFWDVCGDFGSRQDSLIVSQGERGHLPTTHSLMKALRVELQDGTFKYGQNGTKHVCPKPLVTVSGRRAQAGLAFRNTFDCMVSLVLPLTCLLALFTSAGSYEACMSHH